MFFHKKLDRQKVAGYKRIQAEETRKEIETYYLDVIRSMRLQAKRDLDQTTTGIKAEHQKEKEKLILEYSNRIINKQKRTDGIINDLKEKIKEKEKVIEDSQQAWAIINSHLPRMQHLSTKTRMFKESTVTPLIEEFKEAQVIEDEWEAYIRSMDKKKDKINRLLKMDELN